MEQDPGTLKKKRRRRAAAFVVIVASLTATGWWARARPSGQVASQAAKVERIVPEGVRIKVEVLNATDSRGLARVATAALRDAGFDVVYFGNTNERHDSTVVRDRSGHADWASWAQKVMSPASTEVKPDSGRLVDLSILIGARWRPPTEPFRP